MTNKAKSIDENEVAKFTAMADEWWDPAGKFKPLHIFNPKRVEFLRDTIVAHFNRDLNNTPLKDLNILDIGCGGGLLSEPMARLGANVTGIDASEKNIKIASTHRDQMGLDINYIACAAEDLAKKTKKYDAVLCMEIVEHVADLSSFLEAATSLLKPDGIIFIATINRTIKSYALAIIGAEYILRWLPIGTHNWKKFLKPSEINDILENNHICLQQIKGVTYNPLKGEWNLSSDIDVNFMMVGSRKRV